MRAKIPVGRRLQTQPNRRRVHRAGSQINRLKCDYVNMLSINGRAVVAVVGKSKGWKDSRAVCFLLHVALTSNTLYTNTANTAQSLDRTAECWCLCSSVVVCYMLLSQATLHSAHTTQQTGESTVDGLDSG